MAEDLEDHGLGLDVLHKGLGHGHGDVLDVVEVERGALERKET